MATEPPTELVRGRTMLGQPVDRLLVIAGVADPLSRLELRIQALGERLDTLEEPPAMRQGLDE